MKIKTAAILLCFLLSAWDFTYAQNQNIDSLKKVLLAEKEDTNMFNTLIALSGSNYTLGNDQIAIEYGKKALTLANKMNFKKGSINAYFQMIAAYLIHGNYPEALKIGYTCLKLSEEIGDKKLIAHSLQMIGGANSYQGNSTEALKYFLNSLKIQEEIGDSPGVAQAYNSIGEMQVRLNNYAEALPKYSAALKIYDKLGDRGPYWGRPWSYGNIGGTHLALGKKANALGDKKNAEEEFSEALKNSYSCLKFWQQAGDIGGTAEANNQIGLINIEQKKYSEAKKYFDKSLQLATSINYKSFMPGIYYSICKLDTIQGNYKQAFEHYKMYVLYKDSLNNEETKKKSLQAEMQYDFDKKESAAKAAQDKKDVLTDAEISRQKVVRNFSITGAFAVLLLGGFVFYNFRKGKKLESQQALSNERLRISRELHDDIGSTLGSIAVYSDVAKNRSVKNENPVEVLSKIGNASRELIEKMSDIVWSLNPDNETFEQLQHRMQGFAAMILTPRNIQIEFKTDDELKTSRLTNEQRKNIFLIYKEAVHNVVKYAECKNVFISLAKSANNLILTIQDDGKGFDSLSFGESRGEAYNGNGLKNMKARAADMKASLNIISKLNEGTTIELSLHI